MPFVKEGKILPRTYAQISNNITDFVWIEQSGRLVACVGLKDCQEDGMGEIYALAVSEKVQNQGISVELLNKVMQKAVFSLKPPVSISITTGKYPRMRCLIFITMCP
jgi:amino-acid N-acetyltransferase